MATATGVYRNVYRSADHAAESDVRLSTVYNNGQLTGLLNVTGEIPSPSNPALCFVAVDVVDQFGEFVIGAEVYAVTKADVPGANDQLVLEQKVSPILTGPDGRAIMTLIRGVEFSDPLNNTYRIIISTGRNPSEFEFLVPDIGFVVATDAATLPPP